MVINDLIYLRMFNTYSSALCVPAGPFGTDKVDQCNGAQTAQFAIRYLSKFQTRQIFVVTNRIISNKSGFIANLLLKAQQYCQYAKSYPINYVIIETAYLSVQNVKIKHNCYNWSNIERSLDIHK